MADQPLPSGKTQLHQHLTSPDGRIWGRWKSILPEMSNSGSPPAEPGVYPGLIISARKADGDEEKEYWKHKMKDHYDFSKMKGQKILISNI